MRVFTAIAIPFVFILAAGCQFVDRHELDNTGQNEVLRVRSGDRYYLELDENATTGYTWDAVCDDGRVEVKIDHGEAPESKADGRWLCGAPGKARVEIRIHRGFDGAATVRFLYRRPWEKKPAREFRIGLFSRTGDAAFWK